MLSFVILRLCAVIAQPSISIVSQYQGKMMVNWPAVIQFEGDDELLFISNEAEWLSDSDHQSASYTERDRLIDSDGNVYSFAKSTDAQTLMRATDMQLDKSEFEYLIQRHYSAEGNCCVAKFSISSIAEGIRALAEG